METKKLYNNITNLGVLQLFTYAIPLILIPFLTNTYGIRLYGQMVVAISIMVYVGIFLDFGLHLVAPKLIARNISNTSTKERYFSAFLTIKIMFGALGLITTFIFCWTLPFFNKHLLLYITSFFMSFSQTLNPIWMFQGLEKMEFISRIGIASKIGLFSLVVLLINRDSPLWLYPFFSTLVNMLSTIVGLIVIHKKFVRIRLRFELKIIKAIIGYCFPYFRSRVFVGVYTNINTFAIGATAGPTSAGIYNIAEKIYIALMQLYQPFTQVLYPYISRTKDIVRFKFLFKRIILGSVVVTIIFVCFGQFFLSVLFIDSLGETYNVLILLLIAMFFSVPSTLVGYPILSAFGHQNFANNSVIAAGTFHLMILLLLFMMSALNPINVALTLIFTQLIDLGIRIYGIQKHKLL